MSTQIQKKEGSSLTDSLAAQLGLDRDMMIRTIKSQCFKRINPSQISNEQLAAYCQVAKELNINPMLPGMLYAYPDGNGSITPIIGPDGIFKKLREHSDVLTWKVESYPDDADAETPTYAIATIYLKGEVELSYKGYYREWYVKSNPNWDKRPRHMLEIRCLKQAARQIIHGIPYTEDDIHIEREIADGTSSQIDRSPAPIKAGGINAMRREIKKADVIDDSTDAGDSDDDESNDSINTEPETKPNLRKARKPAKRKEKEPEPEPEPEKEPEPEPEPEKEPEPEPEKEPEHEPEKEHEPEPEKEPEPEPEKEKEPEPEWPKVIEGEIIEAKKIKIKYREDMGKPAANNQYCEILDVKIKGAEFNGRAYWTGAKHSDMNTGNTLFFEIDVYDADKGTYIIKDYNEQF